MKKRKGGNVYDFPEFVDVVKKSNSGKVYVMVLDNEKVRAYNCGQSQVKLKKAKVLLVPCASFNCDETPETSTSKPATRMMISHK